MKIEYENARAEQQPNGAWRVIIPVKDIKGGFEGELMIPFSGDWAISVAGKFRRGGYK